MFNVKTFAAAALIGLSSTAAMADTITFAGSGNIVAKETAGATSGLLNISGGTTHAGVAGTDAALVAFTVYDTDQVTSLYTGNAYVEFNGGAGVTTTAVTGGGAGYSYTLTEALTISYVLAAPATILGVNDVTDLLTVTIASGTTISGSNNFFSLGYDASSGVFASDLFRFLGTSDESAGFVASHTAISTSGSTTTYAASVTGNFSADPYPAIPEAPSAALLIGGLAAVAFVNRRRAA